MSRERLGLFEAWDRGLLIRVWHGYGRGEAEEAFAALLADHPPGRSWHYELLPCDEDWNPIESAA